MSLDSHGDDIWPLSSETLATMLPELEEFVLFHSAGTPDKENHSIYCAWQKQLKRRVAVSIARRDCTENHIFLNRVRILSQLSNQPGFPKVFDYGEKPTFQYLVIELLDGKKLSILRNSDWRKFGKHIALQTKQMCEVLVSNGIALPQFELISFILDPGGRLVIRTEVLVQALFQDGRSLSEGEKVLFFNIEKKLIAKQNSARLSYQMFWLGAGIFIAVCIVMSGLWWRADGDRSIDISKSSDIHYLNCSDPTCPLRLTGLLKNGRFLELETIARDLRIHETRFDNGEWKLNIFYHAILGGDQSFILLHRDRVLKLIDDWVSQYPNSITAHIVRIQALTKYGYAEWQNSGTTGSFEERRVRAIDYYQRSLDAINAAEKLSEKDPHLYAVWMRTLVGLHRATREKIPDTLIEHVYQSGRKLAPTYHALYYETAWNYLTCWNGKEGDAERFAMRAHNDTKDIKGFNIYPMIAMHFLRGSNTRKFQTFKFSWEILKEGIVENLLTYPNSYLNTAFYTWFACRWNDREMAQELFVKLESFKKGEKGVVKGIWWQPGSYQAWRDWAFGNGGHPHF